MLDWGLRLVVLLSVPCAVGLLTFAEPLVATLFHRGALQDSDVGQIALALVGYGAGLVGDRKSTRLNSSHLVISYAVFCLKKKKKYLEHELQLLIRGTRDLPVSDRLRLHSVLYQP